MSDFPSISNLLKKSPAAPSDGGSHVKKGKAAPVDAESAGAKFSHKMEEIALKEEEKQAMARAQAAGASHIDLTKFPVSAEALKAVPLELAEKYQSVCFYFTPEELRVGTVEITPEVQEFVYQLGERHHAETALYVISQNSFDRVLQLYANLPVVKPIKKEIEITDEDLNRFQGAITDLGSLQAQFAQVSITDILTLIVASALKINASDIHVEAEEGGIAVRYRIDGILQQVAELPKEQWKQFVSRIKLLAALKINVTDRPQDGRVTLKLSSTSIDVRVSSLPTIYGESVVMRILNAGAIGITLDGLGMRGSALEVLKREVTRPNGMIITTGPTGSGKTTTMYAVLRTLNKPGVKIITLEDPIEIRLEGINQSQVDSSHDYTFAKGLRSILRQDPDICLVGEIRDLETAEIAIQSALTGHLMLSTIHTNSASGAIPRFLSMGVKPFLLAPALNSVIGQRLVRRLCEHCAEKAELDAASTERVVQMLSALPPSEKKAVDPDNLRFYKGKGCDNCNGLGYKGRVGIYEIFIMSKEIEQVILSGKVSEYAMQELAVKQGMVTMAQDGLLKALDKMTTVEEVFRVTE